MPRPTGRKFEASYVGIGQLLQSPQMVAEMLRRAEKAKALGQAIAPRGTGQFAASFTASAEARGGVRHDRACGVLANTDPAAFVIEVGTHDTPAHHTLKRAMFEGMVD